MLFVVFLSIIFIIFLKLNKQFISTLWQLYIFSKTIPGPTVKELKYNTGQKLIPWFEKLRGSYGSPFRIWFGKDLYLIFSDPDKIKTILSSNDLLHKSVNYEMVRPWLGLGLLTNGGSNWHQRRKLLTPAFHFKILGCFKEPIEQCSNILIKRLNQVADGRAFDIYPYVTLHALDAISETAMGIKQHVQENENSDFVVATKLMCKIFHRQFFSFWKRIPFLYKFSEGKKLQDKTLKILHHETERVIKLRRNLLVSETVKQSQKSAEDEFGVKSRLAFLDMLLISQMNGSNLTDENIKNEVDTFMFEGHDTTASAMTFIIYELSQHPEVQNKVYEEVLSMQGKEDEPMIYLEAVIKEGLRLYPSVPFFSRKVIKPIEIGKHIVPVGCSISINAYLLHRNSDVFDDPNTFKPERFLENKVYHPFGFVVFSAGPRNCIGQKFAMLEMKCTLSKLLQAFKILPVDGFVPVLVPELVLKSANGIQVRLEKRLK